MKMEVREKVRKFLLRFIGNYDLKDDENIFENKLVNSLFAMQLVAFLEKEFDITLDNSDFEMNNFKDVNSIVALITSK
jgi:acyl carrier protein